MRRFAVMFIILVGGLLIAGISPPHTTAAAPANPTTLPCNPQNGIQPSGAIYRICMPLPNRYNGQLIIWAHGYVNPDEELHIPEDQLCPFEGGPCINEIANLLGFGFATTSYRKNGLAIKQGIQDILELIDLYSAQEGSPDHIFLIGASEGGIITGLMTEDYPDILSAGLSMCGPIGDFNKQVSYFGDFRALYTYFYPGNFPEMPIVPFPLYVYGMNHFNELYDTKWWPSISEGGPSRMWELIQTANIPYDPLNFDDSIEQSIHDLFRYNVYAANDAAYTLGSFANPAQPFDNLDRVYSGSLDDEKLNAEVVRAGADPEALAEIDAYYQTSGELQIPMVTLHTTLDQQVPYWHEILYQAKIDAAGTNDLYFHFQVDRYEHCNFTPAEALIALAKMLIMANGDTPSMAELTALLPHHADQISLQRMAAQYDLNLR